jgi:type II secretory pathway pseudopilin PulG
VESTGAETARATGQAIKKKPAILWITLAGVVVVVAAVGAFMVFRASKFSQAKHDVQAIALALDVFARENGGYPVGTPAEICRMLRGETVNGQNPKKLDYIEAEPQEMDGIGEFVDPWGDPYRMSVDQTARVYSFGPNHVDERGDGDDIASWK